MKIKALQMFGFKSFGDRTELRFDHKVVGIVGPNGCGKSNIVDAIRWVMGEQSAKGLRGSDMQDVIFNGTSTRKKAAFAEVSLLFDNADRMAPSPYTDVAEIMITRRLYRSGDSEYLINKVPARLKDITDLFLGTGSSARAYSIVAQGKVDQVVLAKPEDRRSLLEEAAGVAKYKVRKQAAERRMEGTRTNLERVNDIIRELERNSRYLERQVERAEKFREIQSELRHLDEQIVGYKTMALDQAAQRNEVERGNVRAKFEKAAADVAALEAEVEAQRLQSLDLEKITSTDYEHLIRGKEEASILQKEAELSEQRIQLLKNQTAERSKDIDRLQTKSVANRESMNQILGEREKLQQDRSSQQTQLEAFRAEITAAEARIAEVETFLKSVEDRIQEQKTIAAREAQKRELLQAERVNAELTRAELEEEVDDLSAQYQKISDERGLLEQELARIQSEVTSLENAMQEADRLLVYERQRQSELFAKRVAVQNQSSSIEAQLQSLLALEEHHVGYDKGALEHREKTGAAFIMDQVKFKPEFRVAGEAFMNEWGQSFLGLEEVEPSAEERRWSSLRVNQSLTTSASPFASSLLDAVEEIPGDERLRAILGSIEVVETLASSTNHPQVDREGRFRFPVSNVISFQSQGLIAKEDAPFSRKADMERLSQEQAQLQQEILQVEESLRATAQLLKETAGHLETYKKQSRELQQTHSQTQKSVARASGEMQAKEQMKAQREADLAEVDARIAELNVDLHGDAVECDLTVLEQERALLVTQDEEAQAHKARLDQEWIEKRIAFGALEERIERLRQQSIDSEMTESEYAHNQSMYQTDIENWKAEMDRETQRIQASAQRREEVQAELQGLETKLAENRKILNQVRSQLEQNEVHRRDLQREKDSVQEEVQRLELEHQRLKYEVEELAQLVQERYHVTLQEICEQAAKLDLQRLEDPVVLGALEVEAKEHREKLEKFGEVNLLALKEFEEINQRLTFMNHQREDLLKTLDTLQSIIDRINHITEFRFRETFKAINHNFQVLFPKLFGGGRAYMTLTQEENLLETGVEIFAEPPGKKVQAMSLLSGGEKAMTAISLLFALFAYRPSSFCIFDEVDAPLDEVNTSRYNAIIKEMSSLSQFIVITHNKRTMEVSDTLFGVTMQEPGVSQLVGVQLAEARAFVASAPSAASSAPSAA